MTPSETHATNDAFDEWMAEQGEPATRFKDGAEVVESVPRKTYRERREARAERLQEWAEKRDAKADAAWEKAQTMADAIPLGQPILLGHHSQGRYTRYRDRIASTMDRALADSRKADDMERRSAGIKAQLDASIYDDDPDAVEQLTARVAALEAERDRIKAYNASCRKGQRDLSVLDDQQRALIVRIAEVQPHALRQNGAFPSYHLSNLSGNIKRNRDRLERLSERNER